MSREQMAVQRARKSFQTGKTKPLEYRIHQLKSLLRFISERRGDIADAVKKDLGKVGLSQLFRGGGSGDWAGHLTGKYNRITAARLATPVSPLDTNNTNTSCSPVLSLYFSRYTHFLNSVSK